MLDISTEYLIGSLNGLCTVDNQIYLQYSYADLSQLIEGNE